jgi:hypothetical protein
VRGRGLIVQYGRGLGSLDRRIMGSSRLYLGTGRACVFQGTQLGTLIRESPFLRDGTA